MSQTRQLRNDDARPNSTQRRPSARLVRAAGVVLVISSLAAIESLLFL